MHYYAHEYYDSSGTEDLEYCFDDRDLEADADLEW